MPHEESRRGPEKLAPEGPQENLRKKAREPQEAPDSVPRGPKGGPKRSLQAVGDNPGAPGPQESPTEFPRGPQEELLGCPTDAALRGQPRGSSWGPFVAPRGAPLEHLRAFLGRLGGAHEGLHEGPKRSSEICNGRCTSLRTSWDWVAAQRATWALGLPRSAPCRALSPSRGSAGQCAPRMRETKQRRQGSPEPAHSVAGFTHGGLEREPLCSDRPG